MGGGGWCDECAQQFNIKAFYCFNKPTAFSPSPPSTLHQLLEHHPSAVLPQVSADSVDRSCWRATVRFSVSLRVGSSGLLGDLAGDPGLHPADERDKVRLATKTLGAAWWRAASRITALSHIGRSACGLAIVFVLVPVTSAAGRGWIPVVDKPAGLAVKIRQIDHF